MSRTVAVVWHASFSVAAGVLYFFFVLPRWPELLGDTSHTLGTVLRIVTGALIGLAALPVVFTLLRTRRPEFGTPQLALTLRTSSIALHVLAGAVIIGAAIAEIWISLDSAGQWLFGIYGAAAAIALLGIFAFYLAFVAELPPPPPKPLKPKKAKQAVAVVGAGRPTKRRPMREIRGERRGKPLPTTAKAPSEDSDAPAEAEEGSTESEEQPAEKSLQTQPPGPPTTRRRSESGDVASDDRQRG
jgi:MFS family permease